MGSFFGELAKKLAERWVGLLALPGLLFVAATWLGVHLGWAHALDLRLLTSKATTLGGAVGRSSGSTQVLIIVELLLASGGVALVVQALTGCVRAWWLGQWPPGCRWAGRRLTAARARRWNRLVANRKQLQERHPKT